MSKIKKGDVVRLKSGSPRMTVQNIDDYSMSDAACENGALCVWFDNKNQQHSQVFDLAVLELDED